MGEPETGDLRPQLRHAAASGQAIGGASTQGRAINSFCRPDSCVLDDLGPLLGLNIDKSAKMLAGVARWSEALIGELLLDRWIGHCLVCNTVESGDDGLGRFSRRYHAVPVLDQELR